MKLESALPRRDAGRHFNPDCYYYLEGCHDLSTCFDPDH